MVSEESKEMLRLFVASHDKCTIGEVTIHMDALKDNSKRLSRITATKIIYEYAEKSIIIIRKGRRGQGYQLSINQDNAFNLISRWITETETIADKTLKSLDIIYAYWDMPSNKKHKSDLKDLLRNFHIAKDVLKMMIYVLLLEIYTKIKSDEDKLTLSRRIMNVLIKTLKYIVYPEPPLTLLELFGYSNLKVSETAKIFGNSIGIQKEHYEYLESKFNEFDENIIKPHTRLVTR